jgi:hypothetical protein
LDAAKPYDFGWTVPMFSYMFFEICSKVLLLGASFGLRAGLRAGPRAGPGPGLLFIACMPGRASIHHFRVMVNGLYDIYFLWLREARNEGPRQPRFWDSPQRNQYLQPGKQSARENSIA